MMTLRCLDKLRYADTPPLRWLAGGSSTPLATLPPLIRRRLMPLATLRARVTLAYVTLQERYIDIDGCH